MQQFKKETLICKVCDEQITKPDLLSVFVDKPTICPRCYGKFNRIYDRFVVNNIQATALFEYSGYMKDAIYKYKGYYDFEMSRVFLEYDLMDLKIRYEDFIVVPAPSTEESISKRGFNHVVEIYSHLGLEIADCLEKTNLSDQKEKDFVGRKKIVGTLRLKDGYHFQGKKLLLVDDVYTTGSTIKAMIETLSKQKPRKMEVLVIAKVNGKKKRK